MAGDPLVEMIRPHPQFSKKELQQFIEKIDSFKKKDLMDLSSDQDLVIGIMNLISIEEHFFFTGAKTGKKEYYDLINEVREIRKTLLKKIIKEYEGEVWCISKHLLAASMRLMESGTKQLNIKNTEEAYSLFDNAYELYCLFWGLNMKMVNISQAKQLEMSSLGSKEGRPSKTVFKKMGAAIQAIINCCLE